MTDRPRQGPKEIRALTGLRGIAAIWVMVFHTMFVPDPGSTIRVVLDHGYLAVDLFFVLSGYVLALNYGRLFRDGISGSVLRTFLWRRFARTYPLYFVMTVVVLALSESRIIALWDGGGQVCNASASALIPNLFLVQSWATHFCSLDAPSWSISTEWGAYLLFPFLSSVLLFGPKTRLWVSAVVAVGLLDALGLLKMSALGGRGYWFGCLDIWDTVTIAPALRCVTEFTIGLVVFRLSQTELGVRVGARAWPRIAVAVAILALLCLRGTDVPVVVLFAALILTLASDRGILAAALGCTGVYFLGEISYSIYLVHYPVLLLTQEASRSVIPTYRAYFVDLVTWFSTIALATVTYHALERPARRILSSGTPWSRRPQPEIRN